MFCKRLNGKSQIIVAKKIFKIKFEILIPQGSFDILLETRQSSIAEQVNTMYMGNPSKDNSCLSLISRQ